MRSFGFVAEFIRAELKVRCLQGSDFYFLILLVQTGHLFWLHDFSVKGSKAITIC